MGFDPEFDRHGLAKGGLGLAPPGGLVAFAAFAALVLLLAIFAASGGFPSPDPTTIAAPSAEPSPYYLVVNRETGYCLDIPYGDGESKTPVEQFPVNGGSNQLWRLEPAPGNSVRVVNAQTGLCLDVPNGTAEPGVAIEQYTRHDGPNQGWHLEEAGDGWCRIVNQLTGLCLQVDENSPARRARIVQAMPGESPYQRWRTIALR